MAYGPVGMDPRALSPYGSFQNGGVPASRPVAPLAPGPNPGQGMNAMGLDRTSGAHPPQQPLIQVSGGGKDCVACFGIKNGLVTPQELEQLKSSRLAEIMAHEQAHASAAGAFGGAIHIEYDGNGIPVGGHVPITIPGLDRMNPEDSIRNFQTIMAAALAPGDPSGQDMAVAAQAQSQIGRAQVLLDQKQQRESQQANAGQQNLAWPQAQPPDQTPWQQATPPKMQPRFNVEA